MKSTTKVLLDEKDVITALARYVRAQYDHIGQRALNVEVKITRGQYSAVVETDKEE
jgi:hypothetical protein